ncbi:hypothetical protein [Streptomyces sp. W1SF4]|uniref:hypothetical protein n=1 Tax=Streptomyces sp. W1SF4 TaxID=2305220 RepID=UPI000F6CDAA4|nr:hypothetical protein [Streptomyces sp. W1SF4]AZM87541.1 hypothetical protein D1J60_02695 [Streptomyces sp. W1SF4]
MNFAFTTLSVVIAAMLTTKVSGAVLIPACLVFVPGAAKASLLIWLGEYHRSQRAGRGAALVESRINGLLGQRDLVGWESRLLSTSTRRCARSCSCASTSAAGASSARRDRPRPDAGG